jgi:hypothetical protein
MLTNEEIKNIIVLVEVGAKALSADKGIKESAQIQATAVSLMEKVAAMITKEENLDTKDN